MYHSPTNNLGSRKLADYTNKEHQLVSRTLNYKTLQNYKRNGMIGRSPEKRGPVARLPLPFLELLESHISMTLLEEREETKPRHLKTIILAVLKNKKIQNFCIDNLYRWFCCQFPDTVFPSGAMETEERQSL